MSFKNSKTIETGLSDCHKMTLTVMKSVFIKSPPLIKYIDNKISELLFRTNLGKSLSDINGTNISYESFEAKLM